MMNHAWLDRHTIIDMNLVELKYYPFMISLNKCTGSCNILYPKVCVPKETKHINVKAFNMISIQDEAKVMTERMSYDCKCKFNSTTCNSKQKWNNKHVNVNVKIIVSANKSIVRILVHVFVRIVSI